MGRLTLNVQLSFAQFEWEVTSERIRDKIAAPKRKGLWVGGMAPLGYDTKNRQITVNEPEAETVKTIFRRYLELGSIGLLMADLRMRGVVTKRRTLKTGKSVGGIPSCPQGKRQVPVLSFNSTDRRPPRGGRHRKPCAGG